MKNKTIETLNKALADKISVVHQYMYFNFHCGDQGFNLISNLFKRTVNDELKHVEQLADRILFLNGEVKMESVCTIQKIKTVKEMLQNARKIEEGSIKKCNQWAYQCSSTDDKITENLFKDLVIEEEKHFNQYEFELVCIEMFATSYATFNRLREAGQILLWQKINRSLKIRWKTYNNYALKRSDNRKTFNQPYTSKIINMTNETKWSIDPTHSEIAFKVRHLMISYVKGNFKTFDASIYTMAKNFTTAEIDLWIDASSITTGDPKRDEHLRGADFFDVKKHKQITFVSSTVGKADPDGNHELWGELTMIGITKNVKLNVEFGGMLNDPWGKEKAGFTITGKIKRSDWGLTWNTAMETGGLMVSDEITISCEIQLINAGKKDITLELLQEDHHDGTRTKKGGIL